MIRQVLVTRPKAQAVSLMQMLLKHQLTPILLPTIHIKVETDHEGFRQAINHLPKADYVIVTSVNAVKAAKQLLDGLKKQSSTKVLSIGPATTKALQECGIVVTETAMPPCSESLLNLPLLSDGIQQKNIMIVTGFDPKPLLRDVLTERGARVEYACCYKRLIPGVINGTMLEKQINMNMPMASIVTSAHSLKNLLVIFGHDYHKYLLRNPLVVITEAMRELAQQLGFKTIWVAKSAADEDIVCCLLKHIVF